MPSTRSLISDKARCFSQSERALYAISIINYNTFQRMTAGQKTMVITIFDPSIKTLNYHHTTTDTNERLAGANTKLYC